MIQTFKGLQDRVLRYVDEVADTSTTRAIVKDALNYAHQQRVTEFPWQFMLWDTVETITTVVGQRIYPLHQEYGRPLYFWNATRNFPMQEVPLRTLQDADFRLGEDEGQAKHFTFFGQTGVKKQPAAATTVSIQSSSASDTGATYAVVIKGVLSNGSVVAESLTPSGVTPVISASTFTKILGVTKAIQWNGTLTLKDVTANAELLSLGACEMGRKYQQLYIIEEPTEVESIEYRFYRQPLVLVNDYDIPEIPLQHAQILVWDALIALSGYFTEMNPQTLATFVGKRDEAQASLYQAFANEQQSLYSMPQYVHSEDFSYAPWPMLRT